MGTQLPLEADHFLVRKITLGDVEEVARLHEAQNERPADREYIGRCIADVPSSLALQGERLVGFVYGRSFAPDLLWLTNLLVDEEYRGRGIGRRLFEHVEEQARTRWAGILFSNSDLWPHPPRPSPEGFYLRLGYEKVWTTAHTAVYVKRLVS